MPVKIAHIAKYSHNIGEGALICGIRETFKEDVSDSVEFKSFDRKYFQAMSGAELKEDSVSMRVDRDFVSHINKNYHMLMIGGGGVFQTGHYDQLGGMAVAGDIEALFNLKRPLVVYGVGDNRFIDTKPFSYPSELLKLLDYIESRGFKFSFRDDGSCERMGGITGRVLTETVDIIPDPGLFIKCSNDRHPLVDIRNKTILFQVAGDRIDERLSHSGSPASDAAVDSFVRNVLSALIRLADDFDAKIVLTPHIPADYALITKFIDVASQMPLGQSGFMRERITVNYCSSGFEGAPNFFSIYPLVDLVIGMRFHSAVCAVGLGAPFIALDTMPKVGGFMNACGLGGFVVSPSEPALDSLLYEMSSKLLRDDHEWRSKREAAMRHSRRAVREFNQSCAALL